MSEELNGFDVEFDDSTSGVGDNNARQLSKQASQVIEAGPNNVVNLPGDQAIDSLDFEGRDLVVILADGTRIVIPEGAIVIPQLVVDGLPIPPANVAALLIGNEPEPAAETQSSGGNFFTDPGEIQAAFEIGDLLPYTELPEDERVEDEVIPGVDQEPEIIIETPDNPAGVENAIATVYERGLPERGQPGEPEGTQAAGDEETTAGTIIFTTPDGLSALLINDVEITTVGQTFDSPIGTLTITSINLATGEIGFSYTLTDNTLDTDVDDNFIATVIDTDGDSASATLTINIVDDGPIGDDDSNTVPGGTFGPITGNVLDNDVSGADDYPETGGVTGFSNAGGSAEPGASLQGEYGSLTLNADGSYTYTRDPNTAGGVTDSFDYDIVDQDGSPGDATLVINIADAPTEITFVPEVGEGTVVDEGGLPPRDDEPVGTGEGEDDNPDNNSDTSESTTGTITFLSKDGLDSVTIAGVTIDPDNLPQTIVDDDTGMLVVTDFTYDPVTGQGTITYEYDLADNTSGDDTSVDFEIVVTDLDGDSATDELTIDIIDDEPEAFDDTGSAGQDENAPIIVDVFANDVTGADDVQDDAIAFVEGSLVGEGSVTYNGDGTFTYTPKPGEEGEVSFKYTITDGDGDVSEATVTITLADDSEPTIDVEGDDEVNEAGLPERGDEPEGSDASSDSEIATGSIAITTGGDTLAKLTVNGQDVTNGGTVVTTKGELTISVTNGVYSYSYELTDNTLSDPDSDTFTLEVTDSDGDTASTSLVIAIIDDNPSAEDDANAIAEGQYGPVGGNVLANDTEGADGAVVTSYTGTGGTGDAGEVVQGTYGKLTIAEDGTYSYTRDPGTPGGVTDTFSYIITDGDTDTATADLVITIANSTTTLDLPTAGEDGTIVDEAGLAGPPAGSDAAGDGEFTSGTFTYTAPDGPATITIDGVTVTSVGQTFTGSFGTMTITAIAEGSISYTYELTTNTSGDDTFDAFTVRVTDQDGDFSEDDLDIAIVDDEPTAANDVDSVTEDGPLVADGNVLTGLGGSDANDTDGVADVTGADGGSVTSFTFEGNTVDAGTSLALDYGTLQIDANGDYVYTLDNANPLVQGLDKNESLTETVTYTLTDGDGDVITATLTITVNGQDDPVVINDLSLTDPEGLVDEDDLADGSDTDKESLITDGTFSVDAQDGLATLTIGGVAVFGEGVTYPVVLAGDYGELRITSVTPDTDANGDTVSVTVEWEYELSQNTLEHTVIDDQDSLFDSFDVVATDSDGSSDNSVLDVEVVDDVPTAENDTAGQVNENEAIEIDALANDVFGADGVDTANIEKVFVSTQAEQGTVTYDPDTGLFTYTPDPGAGSNGNTTDSFEYTIIDRDGDTSTATVNITLQPDSEPEGGRVLATVDDDGLDGNNPASTTGDLLANTGDDPADTSEASFTGTLSVAVGNDTPATVSFAASLNGDTATIGQETVTYTVVGNLLTATVTGGDRDGTPLFTVEVTDATTGAYTVTLLDNVIHDAGNDENDATTALEFLITDSEGETAATFLDITFDDDAPTATDNSNDVTEGGSTGGNVLTDDDGAGVDVAGADDYAAAGPVVGIASTNEGTSQLVADGDGDFILAGEYGTLTLNKDGTYTYQSNPNVTNANVQDVFTYTIRDGDGDEVTATLTIDVADVSGDVSDNDVEVNEKGLPNGTGELADPALNSDQSEIDADGQITVTNAIGPFTYTLVGANSDGDGAYGTLVLNSTTGAYTYTLDTPFTDGTGDDGINTVSGAESFAYEVRDGDNNLIGSGTISVDIIDDVPIARDDANSVTEGLGNSTSGNVYDAAGASAGDNADTIGADIPGAGVEVTGVRTGEELAGGSLTAVGGATVVVGTYGNLTINPDGSYSYELTVAAVPNGATETFTYEITDNDGDTDLAELVISIDQDLRVPDIAGDAVTVYEDGLADGVQHGADSETATGSFLVTDNDEGVTFTLTADNSNTLTDPAIGETLTTTKGVLTITDITDNGNGTVTYEYSYTLSAPLTHTGQGEVNDITDTITMAISDDTGDSDATPGEIVISIVDDIPVAEDDANSVTEGLGNSTSGNVYDAAGASAGDNADTIGADIPGAGVEVTGVRTGEELAGGSLTAVGGATVVAGTYGNLTINPDGSYSYELTVAAVPNGATETFTYEITDNDGDTDLAELVISIDQDLRVPDIAGDAVTVYEDGLADGVQHGADSETATGSFLVTDNDEGVTFTLTADNSNTLTDPAIGETLTTTKGVLTITDITDNGNGTVTYEYSYTLSAPLTHTGQGEVNDITDTITMAISDDTGDSDATPGEIVISIVDDIPTVVTNGGEPQLEVDETDFATDSTVDFSTAFTIVNGADVPGSTAYTLAFTNAASGLVDTLTNEAVTLSMDGTDIVGSSATGGEVFRLSVDGLGNVTLDQSRAVVHPDPTQDNEPISLADGLITLTATQTDADGDIASDTLNIGDNITFLDDGPVAVVADAMTGTNGAASITADLDADNDVSNNFGNDGGRVIFTQASIDSLESQNLTSGLATLEYTLSSDGTQIFATKAGSGDPVFTLTLDPDGVNDNKYVLEMDEPLDAISDISFSDGGYNFVGGNGAWAGFNQPSVDDSFDLLLTPEVNNVNNSTVNTSDIAGGVGSGNSLGLDSGTNLPETLQVNFVQDLTGNPAGSGGYGDGAGNQDHQFEANLVTNGASALFTSSSGTQINIAAYDDTDNDNDLDDGVLDDITGIVISNNNANSGLIEVGGTYNVGGDSYTVTFNVDGTVNVTGVNGSSGAQATGTRIAVFTDQNGLDVGETAAGYTTLEFTYVSGDTVKVGDFGATTQSNEPVLLTVPISVTDNDGDIVDSGILDITLNPSNAPVVLDLDGGGNVFSSLSAGIAYDYNGDGVKTQTAWIAAGSAILAYDANADGFVTNASEFVFGGDGMTDLEAIAAKYDGNSDGVLDANDAAYASFGLWIDADLDAEADAGEFVSLADYGITSIDLSTNGIGYSDADGDVAVFGTASFTMDDGSTGAVSDAAFATGSEVDASMMEALLALGDGPAEASSVSVARTEDLPTAREALNDALAGKVVEDLIDRFAEHHGAENAEHSNGQTPGDFAALLATDLSGGAAFKQAVTMENPMDEAAQSVVVHA